MSLPVRKNIRLKGYDYSQAGYYFITVCTACKRYLFGAVIDGQMILNSLGNLVTENIEDIPNHIKGATIDKYIVMPNHIHILLIVSSDPVCCEDRCCDADAIYGVPTAEKSKQIVPKTMQQFKASVTRKTKIADLWQKKYHDHIIREEQDYLNIWEYIDENPQRWAEDRYYIEGTNL